MKHIGERYVKIISDKVVWCTMTLYFKKKILKTHARKVFSSSHNTAINELNQHLLSNQKQEQTIKVKWWLCLMVYGFLLN